MALRVDAHDGLLLLAAVPYDDVIVDAIRALPERRYRRRTQDWCVPARRECLCNVCVLIGEIEERGIDVDLSSQASARLARADVRRAVLRGDVVEIIGPYSERRLPALRALPERRFDTERRIWTVPLTRAGALAILALADEPNDLVLTLRARRALQRSATASPPTERAVRPDAASPRTPRRSPVAHWRHHIAGAVFDNPARPRLNVPGIGWCVRIRVTPRRGNEPMRHVEA